jgi:hypothetical protein
MASKQKGPGLTGFFENKSEADAKQAVAPAKRGKGEGKYIHITVRLRDEQWERAHQFAASERKAISELCILGLSKLLEEKGLPPL